jgi:hypothetical protein
MVNTPEYAYLRSVDKLHTGLDKDEYKEATENVKEKGLI